MIIDFKNFLFTFSWKTHSPGHKHIIKVWKSIFSTVLVMSAVQNETLKINHWVNHAVPVHIIYGLASQSRFILYLHPCIHLFPHARADTIMTMQVVEHDSQLTKFYQLTIFSLDPQFCTLQLSLYVTSSECWKISPFGSCLKKVSFKSQIHTAECSHHTKSVHKMIQCKFITMW